ncbi:MAG: phage tail assembly protein [Pantoea sp.]|uniref:phage tail assembly protein n=1 Tax=Pantoea piersonii TaxID=2364647 RepID=UPI0028B082A9|nr:phage tail assembly protein [Pantoea piersonii]MDU6432241.1 phage tail assembly protein [Pantoea sp.]
MTDKTTEKAVTLETSIKRGDTDITSVTVRKPQAGALRGIRLQALMDMDVNALMAVLPRVTNPTLTVQEINEMDPADLLSLSVEVITFLLPKSALSAFPTA